MTHEVNSVIEDKATSMTHEVMTHEVESINVVVAAA